MNIDYLRQLIPTFGTLLLIGIKVVLLAVAFEFIAWYAGRRLAALTDSFSKIDGHREAQWRQSRRQTLRRVPRFVARFLIYTVAGILILSVFGVPLLPLALAFGAVAFAVGAGLMPVLRDYSQGYFLLAEDSVAPGDAVTIHGHVGIIEKISLRAIWLRDEADCLHVLSNRDVRDLTILKKSSGVVEATRVIDGRERERERDGELDGERDETTRADERDEVTVVRPSKSKSGVAFDPLDEQHAPTPRPPRARS